MRKTALMSCILIAAFLATGVIFTGVGTSYAQSPAYCDNYARGYANYYANQGGRSHFRFCSPWIQFRPGPGENGKPRGTDASTGH